MPEEILLAKIYWREVRTVFSRSIYDILKIVDKVVKLVDETVATPLPSWVVGRRFVAIS